MRFDSPGEQDAALEASGRGRGGDTLGREPGANKLSQRLVVQVVLAPRQTL